jgi:ppGpp synthetase/RelA/SpoT-type nucleotidyltranferase
MKIDEYEKNGKALYEDFAKVVAAILEIALSANSGIRMQTIQKRAKASTEVRKKLEDVTAEIEPKVKDLAGVRIVVYTNSDIARLTNSDILSENFDIVWERTRIHYPDKEQVDQPQFIGRNYVVRLRDSRVDLSEYKRFAGLQCEVQVQTILDHAWSEAAHDTIYKSPKLSGVGAAQFVKIRERMRDIQQKYLLPAGYEFQQVLNDVERIVSGQRLVESDILESIRCADDNNIRLELLEQFASVVLPIIDDKAASAPKIRSVMVEAVRKAALTTIKALETPIGTIPGRTHRDVLEKIISILEDIQYIEPGDAYAAYSDLYLVFDLPDLKQKVRTAVGKFARHNLQVWRRFGPAVQEILLDAVTATPPERLTSMRPLIIEIAGKCLEAEITGHSSTSTTFTWQTGPIVLSDRTRIVRDRAMSILQELFTSSQREEERLEIYSAMQSATRLPMQGSYTDDLLETVLKETSAVIAFLTEKADYLDLLLKEKIEHNTLFHYRRARDLPAENLKDKGVFAAREAVLSQALALRARFNAIGDFVIFKTLVGFESVFDQEWEEDEFKSDPGAKDDYRKELAGKYLLQVTGETAEEWFDRLNGYATIKSNDLAMFLRLGAFIADVARKSPAIGASWLQRSLGKPLSRFKPGILLGLYESDPDAALNWVEEAIQRHDDLSGIAHFIRHAVPAAPSVLEKISITALNLEDDAAVYKVLEACADRPAEFGIPLCRRLAISAILYLNIHNQHGWTDPLCLWGTRSGLLLQFDDAERGKLFTAMRDLPMIDYRAEEILTAYADLHAVEVIDLFGSRLEREHQAEEHDNAVDGYEAVPFAFHHLHHAMQKSGPLLLPRALEWYRADPHLAEYKSARVVAIMFPELPQEVISLLVDYARSDDREAQKFVLDVMSSYNGADVVFSVLREMVAVLPLEDDLLRGVCATLGRTGVMRGEFGFRDALVAERKSLASWLSDGREPVRMFAEAAIRSLENAIAVAQQDAEADIALRRLSYGEELIADTQEREEDQQ